MKNSEVRYVFHFGFPIRYNKYHPELCTLIQSLRNVSDYYDYNLHFSLDMDMKLNSMGLM